MSKITKKLDDAAALSEFKKKDARDTRIALGKLAEFAAWNANRNRLEIRRGIDCVQFHDLSLFIVFDNNPYADDPDRRTLEWSKLRKNLEAAGIAVLGSANYPPEGHEDARYTLALVVEGDNYKAVNYAFQEAIGPDRHINMTIS